MRWGRMPQVGGIALLLGVLAAGCASPQMKGTPFYTGEYSTHMGPVEERINLWPLLYYRNPALSVLWPIGELTDEHLAVRPLLSVYGLDKDQRVVNVLWPLARFDQRSGENRIFPVFWGKGYMVALPLFARVEVSDVSAITMVGLLYWHIGSPFGDKDGYNGLLPLWSYSRDGEHYSFFAPWPFVRFMHKRGHDGWHVWPLAGRYRHGDQAKGFALWPLGHWWSDQSRDERGSAILPLYYKDHERNRDLFLSLPWSTGKRDNRTWKLAPPLLYAQESPKSRSLITPLWASGSSTADQASWQMLLPLYYRKVSPDSRMFTTLLGGISSDNTGRSWLIYPLLSGGKRSEDGGSFWALAPLIHAEWDKEGTQHHVLPVYYWDSKDRTFLSLLTARWRTEDEGMITAIPPLLSWNTRHADRNDLWLLAGLGHFSTGEKAGPSHMVPFYYRDPRRETFLSPLFCSWKEGRERHRVYPPLLTHQNKVDGKSKELQTPLFGWDKDAHDGYVYPLTPLVGKRTGDYRGGWLFPLFSYKKHKQTGRLDGSFLWGSFWKQDERRRSWIFPVYSYHNDGPIPEAGEAVELNRWYGRELITFPAFWYRNKLSVSQSRPVIKAGQAGVQHSETQRFRTKENGLFPLWSYSKHRREGADKTSTDVNGSLLLALYDYKHNAVDFRADVPGEDYTRARVLWRLYHYEKSDDDVSVDIFPAITYDHRKDGYKKFSVLWRLFRYERKEKSRELDLLFLPLMR